MNRVAIARELVAIAKELTGGRRKVAVDPNLVYDEMKSIHIEWAEGDQRTGIASLKGRKFSSAAAMQRAISKFGYPDQGYDKCGIVITFKDGTQLKNFRYDHGKRDPSFVEQLEWYLENRVHISE